MSDEVMSVQEIIDAAFGDPEFNTVNFRMLKAVLLVLANQLRILNRHVQINVNYRLADESTSNMSVTELRIHAVEKRKKKKAQRGASKSAKDDQTASSSIPEGDIIHRSSKYLDAEERRERELRIINQRTNSHEEPAQTPTPMVSVQSLTEESLIVVGQRDRTPRISVVTQKQFSELAGAVRDLKARFDTVGAPEFPENAEFIRSLREGASLTDAMAAFQLAARMSASEKALGKIVSLLTELARNTPGVDVSQFESLEKVINVPEGVEVHKGKLEDVPVQESRVKTREVYPMPATGGKQTQEDMQEAYEKKFAYMNEKYEIPKDCVTHPELAEALKEMNKEVLENIQKAVLRTATDTKKTEKMLVAIKQRLSSSLDLGERLNHLESVVEEYIDRIVVIDTGLTAQVSSYQDQLTQMQYDLESGLESLEEQLSNLGTDPEVIAELGSKLTSLQQDAENSVIRQKHLEIFQSNMANDMAGLWGQIELIRDAKADREEVTDALRDKISLEDLNGMVNLAHFTAVQGDLELKIKAAYDKFNSQENVWQKFIDDLIKVINEKCDWVNFNALHDDMNQHLNMLRQRVQNLLDVVGEPQAFAVSRTLFRDAKCISCHSPAHMDMKVPGAVPELPAFRRPDDAETVHKPEEHGDNGVCIEGRPIPHTIDPRAHLCNRYCGGSHTTLPAKQRAPRGMIITRIDREVTDTVGSDGKVYRTEEPLIRKPCLPCSVHPHLPDTETALPKTSVKNAPAPVSADLKSSILSYDIRFRGNMGSSTQWQDSKLEDTSLTPPQQYYDD